MNPDSWYVTLTHILVHYFPTTTVVGMVLIVGLLAWHRRDIAFPTLALFILVLSQLMRLLLVAGAFDSRLAAPVVAAWAQAALPLGASALWWIAGHVLRIRHSHAHMAWLFKVGTGILVLVSAVTALGASQGVVQFLANQRFNLVAHLLDFAPFGVLGVNVLAIIAGVMIIFAVSTADHTHPVIPHYQAIRRTTPFTTRRAPSTKHTLEAAHRQIENRLAALNEILEQQHQINALLSHEIRAPLATLNTAVQSLQIMLEGSGKQIDNRLQRMTRALKRITLLMDRLLVPNTNYDEALAPKHENVDLVQLARDVANSVQNDIAHPLQVEAPAPALAWCDGPLTGVMLSNLIHNAAKYSPANEPIRIQVGTLTTAQEYTAWVSVIDRGPGIEKADQEHIFDPHFRHAAHRETKGLGLGLYLVRKICERQGGTLTVESDPGEGARFTITVRANQQGNAVV